MRYIVFYMVIISFLLLVVHSIKKGTTNRILDKGTTDVYRGIAILAIILHHMNQFFILPSIVKALSICGVYGTAIFLFLSGFGNYISYEKNKETSIHWLIKRVGRIYLAFLLVYGINLIILCCRRFEIIQNYSVLRMGKDIITLTLPGFTNWYLKVQVLLYVFGWMSMKITKRWSSVLMLLLSILYVILGCKIIILPAFWWNSVCCFAIGMLVAQYRDHINKTLNLIHPMAFMSIGMVVLAFSVVLGTINDLFLVCSTVILCLGLMIFSFFYSMKSNVLCYLGGISLEMYLIHLCLILYMVQISLSMNINTAILFVGTVMVGVVVNQIELVILKKE